MIDERAYELLCCQLGLANEEKAGLRKQNKELIANAFDSTTVDLCLSVFEWAKFRKHKGGIKE